MKPRLIKWLIQAHLSSSKEDTIHRPRSYTALILKARHLTAEFCTVFPHTQFYVQRLEHNECRQLLLVVRSGPQSYNRAPSLVLLLCVESMCKEHRNSTSTGPSEGKRLIWCRASKSKILCVTKILENTKRQMQKGMKERQTQPGI